MRSAGGVSFIRPSISPQLHAARIAQLSFGTNELWNPGGIELCTTEEPSQASGSIIDIRILTDPFVSAVPIGA